MFWPYYFLNCAQVFYTRRGGGSESPIRHMVRWGLHVKIHTTSFIKINFKILVYVFYDYFYTAFCTGCTHMDGLKWGLNFNNSTENMIDNFSYDFTWYTRSVQLLSGFVEKLKKWASVNPLTFFRQLTAGKNVS
jgi:hypothetical protein